MAIECMNIRAGVEVAGRSDIGCQRENNEDSYLYWEPARDGDFKRKGRLAIIADGMGGHEGGQEASRLAVDTIREIYDEEFNEDPEATLLKGFAAAHARIREYAERRPLFHGMGTTCTAVALRGRELYFAHVGDSRLYRLRGHEMLRLTRDHSYVGKLVESGLVRAEDAEKHPQRHILTSALGAGLELAVDGAKPGLEVKEGDTLLICTDGLWSVVSDDELRTGLQGNSPAQCCELLVSLARERGGPDNITLQVLRIDHESPAA